MSRRRIVAVLRRGIEAGVLASVPQVLIPKLEERTLLKGRESADLGPRFVQTLARHAGHPLREDTKWIAASAFHFGYATFWGALYGLAHERWHMRPWAGGLTMAALIHLITFPSWGGAVLTGTEAPPEDRPWRLELVFATAPLVFGLGTALLYGRGPRNDCDLG